MRLSIYCYLVFLAGNIWATKSFESRQDELLIASPKKIFLYEHEKKDSKDASGKLLLPDRVYVVFSETLQRWVLVRTDSRAQLADPLEVVGFGSVVLGLAIGAKDAAARFQWTENRGWVGTKADEVLHLLVLGPTLSEKKITYADRDSFSLKYASATK